MITTIINNSDNTIRHNVKFIPAGWHLFEDNKLEWMFHYPVTGSECISYGWTNDYMGEVFIGDALYKTIEVDGRLKVAKV